MSRPQQHVPQLPVHPFGPQKARCEVDGCELRFACAAGKWVGGEPHTEAFSGIMVIGEGPGTVELSRRRPFVGPSGRLLDALFEGAGIRRESVWVTNSTLCFPPRPDKDEGKQPFHARFPSAAYACLPRLEAEIEAARPRVIVTLGQTALISIAGYEVSGKRRVPQSCAICAPEDRKIGPVLKCAVGTCDWYVPVADDEHARAMKAHYGEKCQKCSASIKRLKPRRIACPACGGTKTKEEHYTTFAHDHTLSDIAGALLDAKKLPSRLDVFGVEWIIPTYHPAFCLRSAEAGSGRKFGGQYAARAVLEHFEKAKRIASGHQPRFDLAIELTDRPEDIERYLATFGDGPYVVDIETNSEDDAKGDAEEARFGGAFSVEVIKCVGIHRAGQPNALVVDTRSILRNGLDAAGNIHPLAMALYRFFAARHIRKILQNGHFDRTAIWWFWGMHFEGQSDDTLLAHQALYPDEPHKLGHMGACMTDVEAWKPPKKKKGELQFKSFEELVVYNARDLRVTDVVASVMGASNGAHGRLDEERVRSVYDVDMALLDFAVEATETGMPVDPQAIANIGAEAQEACDKAHEDIQKILVERAGAERAAAFQISNPHHVAWALFDKAGPLRLTPQVFTEKTKTASVSKDALMKIADEPSGFVQALTEWKKYDKILSTYVHGNGMQMHSDNRMRPQWKVAKAVTGRWTSSPNFQNWPKNLRAAVVAPPGWKIIGSDYEQLELRIMAALSGDPDLMRRCVNADSKRKLEPDHDPHSFIASLTFNDTFTGLALADPAHRKTKPGEPKCKCQTCKRGMLRDVTKRVIYGLNYGAGAATVLDAIYDGGYEGPPINIALIERVIQVVFRAWPGIPRWRDKQLDTARRTQEVRSPLLGRRRIFPLGDVESTVAYNYPIQSGGADIMNLRLIRLMRALDAHFGPNRRQLVQFIAQVHDAVYFLAMDEHAPQVARLMDENLSWTTSIAEGAPEMPFTAAAQIAQDWKNAA